MDKNGNGILARLKKSEMADRLSLIIALIILVIFFSVQNRHYFTTQNLINILVTCSLMGFIAIGETYLIIANQIDLSAGSVAAFSGVLVAVLVGMGVNPLLALLITVIVGGLIGALNATGINFLNLQPFIATLASMQIIRGFAYILCDGKAVPISNIDFINLGSKPIIGRITFPVILLLLAFIVLGVILKKTYFGRSIYVLGGNPYAARLAGLNPKAVIYKLHILSGIMAALAGALLAARMNSGQPSACDGLEFDGVTAAVLGGCAFTGGVGTILGTFIGMLVLQSFNTGLIMLNVQIFWQNVAQGALLVVALAFDFYRKKAAAKKLETKTA